MSNFLRYVTCNFNLTYNNDTHLFIYTYFFFPLSDWIIFSAFKNTITCLQYIYYIYIYDNVIIMRKDIKKCKSHEIV